MTGQGPAAGTAAEGVRPKVAHIGTVDLSLRFQLFDQLRHLRQAGYDVVAVSSPGPEVPRFEAAGIRHIPVHISRHPFSPLADLRSVLALWRVMRRERFTIVHTHNPKPGFLGQIAARLAGVPIVTNTVHGFYFHEHQPGPVRKFYMILERIAGRFSDVVFIQSAEDVKTALKKGIAAPGKIRHLGNGIDIRRFSRAAIARADPVAKRREIGLPPAGPVVGFVGRLVKEKGVLDLLAAARLVRARIPAVRFVFVGPVDKPKRDAVRPDVAAAYGVADICHFTGKRDDLPELLSLMDVLVLPSYREGLPRVVLEASAMEVPSIVTNIRGCREAVQHGRNGIVVSLGNTTALAEAIVDLLADPARARRMGEEGRRMAVAQFDEQTVFAAVRNEYARLLRERGLGAPAPPARAAEAPS
ncbi:MAG TPA: glycosyltransferase family 4 protein [bacterium]|jgi:glycosyltransferase involved in cell wall biosynthesis|nr:glycosyltransferase family 4 protein [bacterium]